MKSLALCHRSSRLSKANKCSMMETTPLVQVHGQMSHQSGPRTPWDHSHMPPSEHPMGPIGND